MHSNFRQIFNRHFEWVALTTGIILLALMNPYVEHSFSWCLFEWVGFPYCPGEGLGHSIAFIFRGEVNQAMEANILGFFALPVIMGRIVKLVSRNIYLHNNPIK